MKRNNKSMALLVSLALLLCITVGGTVAFLVDVTDPVVNQFKPSEVTTAVAEKNESGKKTNVQITNTGDTEAWIRAEVIINWKNEKGEVYYQLPVAGKDYKITYDLQNGWVQGSDGFYYWTKPVEAGAQTGVLIKSCHINSLTAIAPPAGYALNVEIICSGIQSKPAKAFTESWAGSGLKPNADCTALTN